MRLGQPAGERKDNGFVFLIVVEPTRKDGSPRMAES
jgi:hypothetical protein